MLRRKMYDYLMNWKRTKGRECLLVKGARQVGKTYVIEEFAHNNYESVVEINFYRDSSLRYIFEGDRSADEIYKRMSASIPNLKLVKGSTLIFLDEIQRCSDARTAMKFLAEDGRYDVIASGSLLGLAYGMDDDADDKPIESIPVGYERQVMMYPLDFEEFLWAYGYGEDTIDWLHGFFERKEKVPEDVNRNFTNLLVEYMVTGGMPEVVEDYVNCKDFSHVQQIQEKILLSYEDDISRHAVGVEKAKVRKCFNSIPRQLAREMKKFKYSEVETRSTSRKYGDSVQWLADANLALLCTNNEMPQLPLKASAKENEFKLYMNDTGLLMAMYGFETKKALLRGELVGPAKGGIYENYVAPALCSKGYSLQYYKPGDNMELEFVIEYEGDVVPIEVKAGNSSTRSLNEYIMTYRPKVAFKFITGNVGMSDNKVTLPGYMIMFL